MSSDGIAGAIVAGGGLAGWLAALVLLRAGHRVILVEAEPRTNSGDGRSLALSYASVRVLETLGLWPNLAVKAAPIRQVHISQAGHFGTLNFSAAEMGASALGWVVPAEAVLEAFERAAAAAGADLICPAKVLEAPIDERGGLRRVEIESAESRKNLPTRLLLIADGADSALRQSVGIAHRRHDYHAQALVTTVAATRPQPGIAYERFTTAGVLALLPRPGDKKGLVWTLASGLARDWADEPLERILHRAERAIGGRLGRMSPAAPLRRFPLVGIFAQSQTARRAVVIGNAAHSLHPVAAQGLNLTIRDIATLAECLTAEPDPGADAVLKRYSHSRRGDQRRTMAYTGLVRRLGELRSPPAAAMRAAGLTLADLSRPCARKLARQGMGLVPRPLPAMVRGVPL